jgi:myo-inositol-1(or 4)-monophosphatase
VPDARVDLERALSVAGQAAREAGQVLRSRASSIREIRHKGVVDLVTDVDVESEALVRRIILSAFPDHTIVGEEGGAVVGQDTVSRWHVDPLDGTTNYAHGFPFFCVSIGLEVDGVLAVGAVYDPNLDELFLARRDQPATLNGTPIHASEIDTLRDGLLATGFPYDQARFHRALRSFESLSLKSLAVRRAGSAALDLCYVACGRLEGYWEHRVNSWDVAAGVLLVQQSGGLVTRPDGAPFTLDTPEILAANPQLHSQLVEALAPL